MNDRSVFHLISDITRDEGVSCVLIGGFAVNFHKVSRQTADLDFLITKEDFEKIQNVLKESGYSAELTHENFAQLKSTKVALMDVDFMFVDRPTLEKIFKEGKTLKIAGQSFVVPSLEHLIALKLHSIKNNPKIRFGKDFPDIVSLIRMNKVNVNEKKFKDICLKYGTQDIYQQIVEMA